MTVRESHALMTDGGNAQGLGEGSYQALIVGGVWQPDREAVVERSLGCQGACLWFRCEGAMLWDAYGSMVRSLLIALRRYPSVHSIYVVAQSSAILASEAESTLAAELQAEVSEDNLHTITYLLRHMFGVEPQKWWGQIADPQMAVRAAVRLLEEHPLMLSSVIIKGFLLEETGTPLRPLNTKA